MAKVNVRNTLGTVEKKCKICNTLRTINYVHRQLIFTLKCAKYILYTVNS